MSLLNIECKACIQYISNRLHHHVFSHCYRFFETFSIVHLQSFSHWIVIFICLDRSEFSMQNIFKCVFVLYIHLFASCLSILIVFECSLLIALSLNKMIDFTFLHDQISWFAFLILCYLWLNNKYTDIACVNSIYQFFDTFLNFFDFVLSSFFFISNCLFCSQRIDIWVFDNWCDAIIVCKEFENETIFRNRVKLFSQKTWYDIVVVDISIRISEFIDQIRTIDINLRIVWCKSSWNSFLIVSQNFDRFDRIITSQWNDFWNVIVSCVDCDSTLDSLLKILADLVLNSRIQTFSC